MYVCVFSVVNVLNIVKLKPINQPNILTSGNGGMYEFTSVPKNEEHIFRNTPAKTVQCQKLS